MSEKPDTEMGTCEKCGERYHLDEMTLWEGESICIYCFRRIYDHE